MSQAVPKGQPASRQLRFGVIADGLHSQYWTLKADKSRPDFYISTQKTGRVFHVSLHDPSFGMKAEVKTPRGSAVKVVPWPAPTMPGVIRTLRVFVPRAMAMYPPPPRQGVKWVQAPEDPEVWVTFDVFVEESDSAMYEPRRGSIAIGRVPRSGGGSVAVVASQVRGQSGKATFNETYGTKEDFLEATRDGVVFALLQGLSDDGSLWFLELRTERSERNATS